MTKIDGLKISINAIIDLNNELIKDYENGSQFEKEYAILMFNQENKAYETVLRIIEKLKIKGGEHEE